MGITQRLVLEAPYLQTRPTHAGAVYLACFLPPSYGVGGLGPTPDPNGYEGTHPEILPVGDPSNQVWDCPNEVLMSSIPLHSLLRREGYDTRKLWTTRGCMTQRHREQGHSLMPLWMASSTRMFTVSGIDTHCR